MTHLLPPSLLRLFAARPQLEYAAPLRHDPNPNATPAPKRIEDISNRKRVRVPLTGVVATLERIKQEAADRGEVTDELAEEGSLQTLAPVVVKEIANEERRSLKDEIKRKGIEKYDPHKDPHATKDPYKTLFLGRLAYDVTEKDLHREFDMYGPIDQIRIVRDKEGKSRGYAFVSYERERDMKAAYKDAEGIKINGRRVMVDVERGRTVKDWKPTRLGGGLGGSARKPKKVEEPVDSGPKLGGGFGGRGGFRGGAGGFRGGRGGGGFGAPRGGGGGFSRGGYGGARPAYDGGYGGGSGGSGSGSGGARSGGYGGAAAPRSSGGGYGSSSSGPPRGYPGTGANSSSYDSRGPGGGGYGTAGSGGYDDGPPNKRSRY
ncbi:RNA-binding domain-containing protein [Testicularia cyperi]|uniref:U1 small nuclear ribonucleoprotein 70 kDa n=1 Tax=Testicularia cyperi TaxID=1882483 RepID=A0A317XFD1_9BASI|nr:RNA-binding domain-containing protein [Testicularia cyperi]